MHKKNIFLKQFLLLHTCFVVHKMQSSYTFETRINENLTLSHTYPQQITSKTLINNKKMWSILCPKDTHLLFAADDVTKISNNKYEFPNLSFFPEQSIVAVFNRKQKCFYIYCLNKNKLSQVIPLDQSLTMVSFFLDYYSDKETKPNEAVPHLFIIYKTTKADTYYIAEQKIENQRFSQIRWRLINANEIISIKDGQIKYLLDTQELCDYFTNIAYHLNKKDLDRCLKDSPSEKPTNLKSNSYILMLISSGSIILFLILWYRYS